MCVGEGERTCFSSIRVGLRERRFDTGRRIGFWLGRGAHNLVLNCDAYRNHDYTSEDGRGGNVDGFGFHAPKGSVGNVFRGCRAWFNSDDGFDFITTTEPVIAENCWAFYNGYDSTFKSLADGNGFKAGGYAREPASRIADPVPRHVVRYCVASRNKASGFYANHQPGGGDWIHNIAYGRSRSACEDQGTASRLTTGFAWPEPMRIKVPCCPTLAVPLVRSKGIA